MEKNQWKESNDRIEGDTIILHDDYSKRAALLKKVLIITPSGIKKAYEIKRTKKGGYLFN
jgi:hypothetical protein